LYISYILKYNNMLSIIRKYSTSIQNNNQYCNLCKCNISNKLYILQKKNYELKKELNKCKKELDLEKKDRQIYEEYMNLEINSLMK